MGIEVVPIPYGGEPGGWWIRDDKDEDGIYRRGLALSAEEGAEIARVLAPDHAALQAQVATLTAERDEARTETMQARASADYWKADSKRVTVDAINLSRCLDEAKRERDKARADVARLTAWVDAAKRGALETSARLVAAEKTAERWKREGNVWNAHPEGTTDASLAERRARADEMLVILDDRLRLQKQVMAVGELAGRLAGVQEVHPTLHRALEGDTPHQERGRYAAGVAWDIARDLRAIVGGTAEEGGAS